MKYIPVDSSDLHGLAYDAVERALYVQFHTGSYYKYSGIDSDSVTNIMFADSHGKAFKQNVQGLPYERMGDKDLESVGLSSTAINTQNLPEAPVVPPTEVPQQRQDVQPQSGVDVNGNLTHYPMPDDTTNFEHAPNNNGPTEETTPQQPRDNIIY